MEVEASEARYYFERLPSRLRAPGLHPHFVCIDAAREPDLQPTFFVFKQGDDFYYHGFHLAALPVGDLAVEALTGEVLYDVQSPFGYGGPVATTDDRTFLEAAWKAWQAWCEEQGVLVEFLRFHPLLGNDRFFGGEAVFDRHTVAVDLAAEDLLAGYSAPTRRAIEEAQQAGCAVEHWATDDFLGVFSSLYRYLIGGKNPDEFFLFPLEYFERLMIEPQAFGLVCHCDCEPLAAGIFLVEGDVAEFHLSSCCPERQATGASHLLLHEGALQMRAQGCRLLHLGGGTDGQPDNPQLFFKSGFSERREAFRIGKAVHAPLHYQHLKNVWQQTKQSTDRVLFYRTP